MFGPDVGLVEPVEPVKDVVEPSRGRGRGRGTLFTPEFLDTAAVTEF